jgi:hypothetical protein
MVSEVRAKARTGGNQSGLICVTGLPDPWAPRMMPIKRREKERRKNAKPRVEHHSITLVMMISAAIFA